MLYMVTREKYGFRDHSRFSELHKQLGQKLYCMDLDLLELSPQGDPVAALELKHFNLQTPITMDFKLQASLKIANKLQVPFYIVIYVPNSPKVYDPIGQIDYREHQQYYAIAVNQLAKQTLPKNNHQKQFSQAEFSRFLHWLRDLPIDSNLYNSLDKTIIDFPLPPINI